MRDTATSTTHVKEWGVDDGAVKFNHLYDTMFRKFTEPGHYTLISVMESRFGCIDSAKTEFTVGYHSEFTSTNPVVCAGDTVKFYGYARYYVPFSVDEAGLDNSDYWSDPQGIRGDRNPVLPEKISWDMDGDSIIDAYGTEPSYAYSKSGNYTVRMFTTDSMGCTKMFEKKSYVQVLDIRAGFAADTPVRYCAPHTFRFFDSSYVFDPVTGKRNSGLITYWMWDFGDGSPALNISDPTKKNPVHFYKENGVYAVTLTVRTSDATGALRKGCSASYTDTVQIIGPVGEFEPLSPLEGCVPFTVKMLDRTSHARIREWKLGDGTAKSSNGEDTVYLVYNTPGIYCPELIVADTVRDLKDSIIYCSGSFPIPPCKYRIIVHDTARINLFISDTVLCAGLDEAQFTGYPDTGYAAFYINYGDGFSDSATKPGFRHTYANAGTYTVSITGRGAQCPKVTRRKVYVVDTKADFYWDESRSDTPRFVFVNTSQNGVYFEWNFGDGSPVVKTTSMADLPHDFRKPGKLRICLVAYNDEGCPDTMCRELEIITCLFIPNVFTPVPPDGYNDRFVIDICGETYYELHIYNRWGEEVFSSSDEHDTWDGSHKNNPGVLHAPGTYYFVFNYQHIGGRREKYKGTVTMIRD
ncbi:MAG: PKD domain-containing protein [Bacteroidota bacterium]|nr:PKD domain-containing protein [Bacteroidota bacterium]